MIQTDLTREAKRRLAKRLGVRPGELCRAMNRAAPPVVDVDEITIPTNQGELESLLSDMSDPNKAQKIFAGKTPDGKPAFMELIRRYAQNMMGEKTEIAAQVREQTQIVLAEVLKEWKSEGGSPLNLNVNPTDLFDTHDLGAFAGAGKAAMMRRQGLFQAKAIGTKVDNEFKGERNTSADFFYTISSRAPRTTERLARLDRLRNAFSSDVPSEGGFLIPEQLRSELLRVALETAIVRPRARIIPMETLNVPFPMIDATSNVSSIHGGITAAWTEEGAAMDDSEPKFGRLVLNAKKLTAYTEVPAELLVDSLLSLQAFIDQAFPEALSFYEDDAFFNGTGVGMPLGALHALNTAAISISAEGGQDADTIVWQNIIKMFSRMLPSSLGRAVWVASIDSFVELATMALTVGTGGSAVWLNNGVEGPPATILGRPVIFSEKVPVLGSAGDINFIDWAYYLIGDRQAMSAASSDHFKFNREVTAFRITERVDGKPWLQSAITPKNNGPTLSPFVKIEAR